MELYKNHTINTHYFTITTIFLLPLIFLLIAFPSDWFGWVLFYLSFIVVISTRVSRERKVLGPVLFVLCLHHLIAITNAFIFTVPGADADAVTFHKQAELVSQYGSVDLINVGSSFYINFLALFYKIFGASVLMSSQISVLSFALSLIVLLKLCDEVGLNQIKKKYVVLFFGLLPSVVFFTSVPLRESLQILCFLSICYLAIKLKKKRTIRGVLKVLLALLLFSLLHNGLLALSPLFAFVIFCWVFMKPRVTIKNVMAIATALIVAIGIFGILQTGFVSSPALNALLSGSGAEYVSNYRTSNLDARASYGVQLDTSGVVGFLTTSSLIIFYYFFSPLPWQVRGVMDLVGLLESFIRFVLIVCAFKAIKKSEGDAKVYLKFLLLMFFLLEFMWAMGTLNWGTAMRHHIVAYSLLVLAGGRQLFNVFIKKATLSPREQ